MNTLHRIASTTIAVVAAVGLAASAQADDALEKSGTVTLSGWKVAFIGSAGQSKGVLTYGGKARKFKMTGLGIGGYGVSTSEATGVVYNLKSAEDFTGSYVSGRSGVTVGEEEVLKDRTLWLQNSKGVKIELVTEKEGLELNLGADGSMIVWDD